MNAAQKQAERLRAAADVPSCPKCKGPSVTIPFAPRPECYDPEKVNLVCCACGDGWMGTPAEFERAQKADAVWETVR